MPIIAKLSKRFYDRFGEEIANELVELFNQVDSTSRADLRELNEANFARFDARLDGVVNELNAKIGGLADKESVARLDGAVKELSAKTGGLADKESLVKLEASVYKALLAQTRWMLAAWVTIMLAILAQRL